MRHLPGITLALFTVAGHLQSHLWRECRRLRNRTRMPTTAVGHRETRAGRAAPVGRGRAWPDDRRLAPQQFPAIARQSIAHRPSDERMSLDGREPSNAESVAKKPHEAPHRREGAASRRQSPRVIVCAIRQTKRAMPVSRRRITISSNIKVECESDASHAIEDLRAIS
jgi:hypothetical protein